MLKRWLKFVAVFVVLTIFPAHAALAWSPGIASPYSGLTYLYNEGAFFQFYLSNPFEVSNWNQNNLPPDNEIVLIPPENRFAANYLFAPDNRINGTLVIGNGYGFVDPNNPYAPPPSDLIYWLQALEWPTTNGYYNVTDAGAKQGSTAVRNIFYHNYFGAWVAALPHQTNATKTNPMLVEQRSSSSTRKIDVINDGQYDYYAAYYDPSLPEIGGKGKFTYLFNFTQDAAIGFVHRVYQLFPNVQEVMAIDDLGCELKKAAFTIDLSIPQVSCGAPGTDGKAPFAVVINNLSPFDANNVRLMLYTYSDGDQKPTLVYDQTIPRINRASVAAGTPGSTTVTGFIPAPSRDFKLIAAANVQYFPGGFTVSGVPGAWAADSPYSYQPTFNGQSPPGLGSAVSEPYLYNNVNISGTTAGAPGGGGGGGGGDGTSANLVAVNVTCDPDNSNTVAKFRNAFPVNGRVNVRFYFQPEGDNMKLVDQRLGMAVQAGSEFTVTTTIPDAAAGKGTVTATVDLRLSGSSWVPEKYRGDDGKEYDETTYEDNKTSCAVAKKEYYQDTPEDHPAWYFPVKEEWVPKYEEYTEPVYGWKKVPFIKDPATGKIRVLLVE